MLWQVILGILALRSFRMYLAFKCFLCTISIYSKSAAPNSYANRAHIISAHKAKKIYHSAILQNYSAIFLYNQKRLQKIPIAISKIHSMKRILKYIILYMNVRIIYVFLTCVMYPISFWQGHSSCS